MKKTVSLYLIIFFMASLSVSSQNIVFVVPGGTGTGTSWSDPMGDINAAVVVANSSTPKKDVWVKGGEFTLTSEIIVNQANVYGSFAGTETAVSEREAGASGNPWDFSNPTVLKGNGSNRVIQVTGGIIVDGFTITNGGGVSTYLNGLGGGLIIIGKSTVQNCIISGSKSTNNDGGGVSILDGTLSKSLVENNYTSGTTGNRRGGGIFTNPAASASATIKDCTVRSNTSFDYIGGGFTVHGAGITLVERCKIYNNRAVTADGTGFREGGALNFTSGNVNSSVINCLIYNNRGGSGIITGNAKFYNNTIVNNTGHIQINSATASYNWTNNIIWGNTNSAGLKFGISGSNTNGNVVLNNNYMDYCAAYPGLSATGANNVVDNVNTPQFVSPSSFIGWADNITKLDELINSNFQLNSGSPCIDMGKIITEVTIDIEGINRPLGTAYDAGAYEFDPTSTSLNSLGIGKYTLLTKENGIEVQGLEGNEKVSVYRINGTLVYSQNQGIDKFIFLDNGFYVVRVANESFKVLIK